MYSLEAYKRLINSMLQVMENNEIEIKSGTIRLDYSGRGMYGVSCLGIVMDRSEISAFKMDFVDEVADIVGGHYDKDTKDLFKRTKSAMRSPSADSMGLSMIEYYTSLKVPSEYVSERQQLIKEFTDQQ